MDERYFQSSSNSTILFGKVLKKKIFVPKTFSFRVLMCFVLDLDQKTEKQKKLVKNTDSQLLACLMCILCKIVVSALLLIETRQ